MKSFLVALLLWSAVGAQAQAARLHSRNLPGSIAASPSSVDAGDYIYISGQGPRSADGALPATFAAQARQALTNLKSVVETAGLTMDHVVYTTVYLTDIRQYGEMNHAFGEFFGKIPPARAVLGVAGLPDPPIEINAVAVRNLSERRAVLSAELQVRRAFFAGHSHSRSLVHFCDAGYQSLLATKPPTIRRLRSTLRSTK